MTLTMNRRGLLTSLGKAFGAGGLILSSGRAGALVLPSNLEAAASLPLSSAALPVSADLIELRGLVDDQHAFRLNSRGRQTLGTHHEYYTRSLEIRDVSDRIAEREHKTWADCVELAELCWHIMPKEHDRPGFYEGSPLGQLTRNPRQVHIGAFHCAAPLVALIEAVLTMGNGERRDPKTDQGRF